MRAVHGVGDQHTARFHKSSLRTRTVIATLVAVASFMTGGPRPGPVSTAWAGASIPNLTPSTSGIHLGLMFNWQVNTAPGETKGAEVGVDNYVYGAEESAQNANIPAAGVHHTGYYPLGRDHSHMPNEIASMKTNHPDWIVYRSDRSTPAWYNSDDATNGYQVPIDITNPAVQNYMMSSELQPDVTTYGYQGIAFDQAETLNYTGRAGVYSTATTLASTASSGATTIKVRASIPSNAFIALGNGTDMEYLQVASVKGKGPYTVTLTRALKVQHSAGEWIGTWRPQYNGNILDTAYRSATSQAFQQIVQKIKAANPSATVSINDSLNMWNSGTDQNGAHSWDYWRDLVPFADIVVSECGVTNCGDGTAYVTSDTADNGLTNPWLAAVQDFQWASSQGKAVMIVGYEPYQVTSNITATDPQARFDLQWNLAGYLLVRGDYTYLAWRGSSQVAGEVYWQPEYSAPIGVPTDAMYQSQGVWMRDYTGGLAVVNPSGSTVETITLPANSYQDLYGHAVSTYTLAPHSGVVLLVSAGAHTAGASSPRAGPLLRKQLLAD